MPPPPPLPRELLLLLVVVLVAVAADAVAAATSSALSPVPANSAVLPVDCTAAVSLSIHSADVGAAPPPLPRRHLLPYPLRRRPWPPCPARWRPSPPQASPPRRSPLSRRSAPSAPGPHSRCSASRSHAARCKRQGLRGEAARERRTSVSGKVSRRRRPSEVRPRPPRRALRWPRTGSMERRAPPRHWPPAAPMRRRGGWASPHLWHRETEVECAARAPRTESRLVLCSSSSRTDLVANSGPSSSDRSSSTGRAESRAESRAAAGCLVRRPLCRFHRAQTWPGARAVDEEAEPEEHEQCCAAHARKNRIRSRAIRPGGRGARDGRNGRMGQQPAASLEGGGGGSDAARERR